MKSVSLRSACVNSILVKAILSLNSLNALALLPPDQIESNEVLKPANTALAAFMEVATL